MYSFLHEFIYLLIYLCIILILHFSQMYFFLSLWFWQFQPSVEEKLGQRDISVAECC